MISMNVKAVPTVAAASLLLLCAQAFSLAQDRDGSKDHPAVGRYKGSYIKEYEQKEYEEIEDVIRSTEGALKVTRQQMADCAADYTRLNELAADETRLAAELDHLMERWAYLEEIAEEQ